MELFSLWLWPLIALIVLPAMLVYFGLHVVGRGVIFVDLALAQIAALGIATAVLLGAHPEHDLLPQALALAFTMAGAALFSLTRFRHPRVPQEAIIGITFVVAAAAVILLLSRVAGGKEELEHLLTGDILNVSAGDIGKRAATFAVLGVFYAVFHKRFALISEDVAKALAGGSYVRLWDFLFYAA